MSLTLISPQAGERHEFLSGSVRHSTHRPHTQTPELPHHRGARPGPPHADQEPDQPLHLTGRCHMLLLLVSCRGHVPCGRARSMVPCLPRCEMDCLPPNLTRYVTSSQSFTSLVFLSFSVSCNAHPTAHTLEKKKKKEGPRMVLWIVNSMTLVPTPMSRACIYFPPASLR